MLIQVFITLGIIVGYFVAYLLQKKLIATLGEKKSVPEQRIFYIQKYFNALFLAVMVTGISITWSIDYRGLMIVASSMFAVLGVALFAQWSILSNITSSVIIFFTFPARIGNKIKIVDGENTVSGEIKEITLFQVLMVDEEGIGRAHV